MWVSFVSQATFPSNIPKLCAGSTSSISVPLKRRKEIVRITNKMNLPPIRKIVLLNGRIIPNSHKSSKSKRIKLTEKASPNPKRIKTSDQCLRKSCRKRGTHKNHSHDDCKFKESENTKFTNLGKAPAKKQRNAKTNSSQPTKHVQPLAKNANGAKCYMFTQYQYSIIVYYQYIIMIYHSTI